MTILTTQLLVEHTQKQQDGYVKFQTIETRESLKKIIDKGDYEALVIQKYEVVLGEIKEKEEEE